MQDCTVTYWSAPTMTQGDLVWLAKAREYDIERCNVDKAAIREWLGK
ncbi:o-spanin [Xanthomonas phage SB3]|uniref:O-spanin n=1 Tax=Xanthomonas phage SB3 TaxID=3117472 RepID=A0ABZ2GYF0_9CAUD